jgi:hypothetical protein
MNPAIDAVYNCLKTIKDKNDNPIFSEVLIYYDEKQMLSEQKAFDVIDWDPDTDMYPTDPLNPDGKYGENIVRKLVENCDLSNPEEIFIQITNPMSNETLFIKDSVLKITFDTTEIIRRIHTIEDGYKIALSKLEVTDPLYVPDPVLPTDLPKGTIFNINIWQFPTYNAKLKIKALDELQILEEKGLNVADKYLATINNTYTDLRIVSHETIIVNIEGEDTHIDLLEIANVPAIIKDVDSPTTLSLTLISSIFLSSRPNENVSFSPRKNVMYDGFDVDIQINTRFDKDRKKNNELRAKVLRVITQKHRKFDLVDDEQKTVGYYKLVDLPFTSGYVNDEDNLQSITIGIKGFYPVDYCVH